MSNNGSNNPQIGLKCPTCQQVFSVSMPRLEISNNFLTSVVCAAHEKVTRCPNNKCRQPIVLMLGHDPKGQLMWGGQSVTEEFVAQMEGSRIIKPELKLIG